MPAISVSMRGTNWLSADCADFTDRETLVDRPSAPCLLFVRVWCATVPASFWSICSICVICGLSFWKSLPLPDHLLRPEHRPLGANALIRPVPLAHHTDAAAQAHSESAAHAALHRDQAAMPVLLCQHDRSAKHRPGAADHEQKPLVPAPLEVLFERPGHVTAIAARAVLRCEYGGADIRFEILNADQVPPRAAAEEQPLAHPRERQLSRRQQQRRNADAARHVQDLVRSPGAVEVFFLKEAVTERREHPDPIAGLEFCHQPRPAPHDLIEQLDDFRLLVRRSKPAL